MISMENREYRSILEMSDEEARSFLLKEESYCEFILPPYFSFKSIVSEAASYLQGKRLSDLCKSKSKPSDCERVNHRILSNKDGQHAWRPLELIHPVLYAALVNLITEKDNWQSIKDRFAKLRKLENISSFSIPIEAMTESGDREEQIFNWWSEIEQRSLELALEYETIVQTDITDCYAQIYTHSIAWALHSIKTAKDRKKDDRLIGNHIDWLMQDMRYGQTNGIPQGSVLMDFIAEIVLAFADYLLDQKLQGLEGINDYRILRYRDDYRIFVHSAYDGERILKSLTEVLITLGLHLNSAKTETSNAVIQASIKRDKLAWLCKKQGEKLLQHHLLILHQHGVEFPNSGSLFRGLVALRKRIDRAKKIGSIQVLVSILADIAYRSPRTYPQFAALLSRLLDFVSDAYDKYTLLRKIQTKFSRIPNTNYMEIWLQRIALPLGLDMEFAEPLCKHAAGQKEIQIWNSQWIGCKTLKDIMQIPIVDYEKIQEMKTIIPADEVELFLPGYSF